MDIACQRDQRMLVDGLRHLRRRRYLSQRGLRGDQANPVVR